MPEEGTGPPGLDLQRLGDWLSAEILGAGAQLTAKLIAGGRSNLTYEVSDGTDRWIIRRPPLGHVLATAHDMAREYRVLAALQSSGVPVPRTYAFCDDKDVIGSEFYVMELCPGTPFRWASELVPLGADRTCAISQRLVDTLATLHAVDPAEAGLSDFGRPEGFLGRQVARWKGQLEASYTRDLPAADELHRILAAKVPAGSARGIVHGDFRLDNLLVDDNDRVTAVLDWEMATLGDPLTDLALMLVYSRLGAAGVRGVTDVASAPGFLDEKGLIERYARSSDRDVAGFGFYLGLAAFKLAAILEGIHYRHLQGQTVGDGFQHLGDAIPPLLEAGLEAVKETD